MRKSLLKCITVSCLVISALILPSCNFNMNSNPLKSPIPFDFDADDSTVRDDAAPVDIDYRYKFIKGISGDFSAVFINLIPAESYTEWLARFEGKNPQGTRAIIDLNLVTFIREFNISKQDFSKANSQIKQVEAKDSSLAARRFTQKEIDVLFSGESALINKTFVNPNALLYNGEIYTLEWFAKNTVENYSQVGFPLDLIANKCDEWKKSNEFSVRKEGLTLAVANVNSYAKAIENNILVQAEDFLFHAEYCWNFYNIPTEFANLVGDKDSFDAWANQFKAVNFGGTLSREEYTILGFIENFGIQKDDFVAVNNDLRDSGTRLFNDTQIDALFSDDDASINNALINPLAILYNNTIYPPKWFSDNDARAYASVGFPLELLQNQCIIWEKENIFASQLQGIKGIKDKIAAFEIM